MRKYILIVIFTFFSHFLYAQYRIYGDLKIDSTWSSNIYLSLIENHHNINGGFKDQIIESATIDSLGHFSFEGNHLPIKNRIYKIHIVPKGENEDVYIYNTTSPGSNFILFIANNKDTVRVSSSESGKFIFDEVVSDTNPNAGKLKELSDLKVKTLESSNHYSKKSNELFLEYFFKRIKEFCDTIDEPLVGLIGFDYLIQIDNYEQTYILNDFAKNDQFYSSLLQKVKSKYPRSLYFKNFEDEITLLEFKLNKSDVVFYKKIIMLLSFLIIISIGAIIFLMRKLKKYSTNNKRFEIENLTSKEKEIIELILESKSNKEIADILYVSLSTVKTHINNIYGKINVKSRKELKNIFQPQK